MEMRRTVQRSSATFAPHDLATKEFAGRHILVAATKAALLCGSRSDPIFAPPKPQEDIMIRSYALATAAAFAALTSVNAFAADPLPTETHKVLTWELAVEAAQAAIAACKQQGYNVSVTVADREGNPKVFIVRDGPRGVGPEVTLRKAYTAAMQRVSTADFGKRVSQPNAFNPGQFDAKLSPGPGGVPIKVGDDTIGGIAAAGAPGGDKDEACAIAGLNKIKDRLN